MKPYLVFSWYAYESGGGWNDFCQSFNTHEEAKKYLIDGTDEDNSDDYYRYQIVYEGKVIEDSNRAKIQLDLKEKKRQEDVEWNWKKLKPILQTMEVSQAKIQQIAWLNRNLNKIKNQHPLYPQAMTLIQAILDLGEQDIQESE
jgi:hypothetical protein